jgi:hypothetical protein
MGKYAGTPVHRCSEDRGKTHSYATSPANEYPDGSVPRETGWERKETFISKIPGNNRITVCRPKRG